jgi:hypothetical protein
LGTMSLAIEALLYTQMLTWDICSEVSHRSIRNKGGYWRELWVCMWDRVWQNHIFFS